MKQNTINEYRKKYKNAIVRVTPYTINTMQLIQSKTILKLENYNLSTIPFSMAMSKVSLLLVLSKEENIFFHNYINQICKLYFAVKINRRKQKLNFFIQGYIGHIRRMKNNVYDAEFVFKNAPDVYVQTLGNYLENYFYLQKLFYRYKNKSLQG